MNYHCIKSDDMNNGDGLRAVLFISGCTHQCKNCHNPETWNINSGTLFDDKAKTDLFSILSRDYISGITFSGGDPLHPNNRETTFQLIKEIKTMYPNKTIWLYTGFKWEDIYIFESIKYIDVLVDDEFIDKIKDIKLHWCGSSNQKVIDVQKSLKEGKVILWE